MPVLPDLYVTSSPSDFWFTSACSPWPCCFEYELALYLYSLLAVCLLFACYSRLSVHDWLTVDGGHVLFCLSVLLHLRVLTFSWLSPLHDRPGIGHAFFAMVLILGRSRTSNLPIETPETWSQTRILYISRSSTTRNTLNFSLFVCVSFGMLWIPLRLSEAWDSRNKDSSEVKLRKIPNRTQGPSELFDSFRHGEANNSHRALPTRQAGFEARET